MRRIIIVGSTGTGKTTLAAKLAVRLGLTHIDLDNLFWNPGWVYSEESVFRERIIAALPADRWVITGNYSKTRDLIWPHADTLIWMDYSFPRTFLQLTRRTYRNVTTGRSICNGNRENLWMQLSSRSIFLWLFKTYMRNRKQYKEIFASHEMWPSIQHYIRLKTPAETEGFLKNVTGGE